LKILTFALPDNTLKRSGMEVYKQIMIMVSFDNPEHQNARDGMKRK
jgi:hypothetical protein